MHGTIMDQSVDDLFPTTPATVRAILAELRHLVRDTFPKATEIFYHGAIGYVPTASGFEVILYLAPQNGYVNLGFYFGAGVTDPLGLLEGSGKRMRHVKIRSVLAAQNPALIPMMQEGWSNGMQAYAQVHETRRQRRESRVERQAERGA
jgi:hypothetical protein